MQQYNSITWNLDAGEFTIGRQTQPSALSSLIYRTEDVCSKLRSKREYSEKICRESQRSDLKQSATDAVLNALSSDKDQDFEVSVYALDEKKMLRCSMMLSQLYSSIDTVTLTEEEAYFIFSEDLFVTKRTFIKGKTYK